MILSPVSPVSPRSLEAYIARVRKYYRVEESSRSLDEPTPEGSQYRAAIAARASFEMERNWVPYHKGWKRLSDECIQAAREVDLAQKGARFSGTTVYPPSQIAELVEVMQLHTTVQGGKEIDPGKVRDRVLLNRAIRERNRAVWIARVTTAVAVALGAVSAWKYWSHSSSSRPAHPLQWCY
jgi:hypothetical protein